MEQYETEEQQVEAIKRFWKENGSALIIGAVLGLAGLYGWRYYNDSQIAAKEQASNAYETTSIKLAQDEKGFTEAKAYLDEHGDTGYATLMALELAQKAADREDFSEAAKQLEYVVNNTSLATVKYVAQLRLARIQLAQGEFDLAISNADKVTADAFKSQSLEIKGDAYLAQQLFDKARAAYSSALESGERNQILKMKLDNLAVAANG
ncbi:YfgM family protein [Paraglaciecola sp. 2405UD69-4]|uniref:YfgM family protein n=1 Tax=Paraglaciecola sp. 2405UD69-4 TaxID=3391836 RepID=UPI0039C8CA4B